VFKDKKEAIEAFKDLLRERVRCWQYFPSYCFSYEIVRYEFTSCDNKSASALSVFIQNYWVFGLCLSSYILENQRAQRLENWICFSPQNWLLVLILKILYLLHSKVTCDCLCFAELEGVDLGCHHKQNWLTTLSFSWLFFTRRYAWTGQKTLFLRCCLQAAA
jgi:hypothetical protein